MFAPQSASRRATAASACGGSGRPRTVTWWRTAACAGSGSSRTVNSSSTPRSAAVVVSSARRPGDSSSSTNPSSSRPCTTTCSISDTSAPCTASSSPAVTPGWSLPVTVTSRLTRRTLGDRVRVGSGSLPDALASPYADRGVNPLRGEHHERHPGDLPPQRLRAHAGRRAGRCLRRRRPADRPRAVAGALAVPAHPAAAAGQPAAHLPGAVDPDAEGAGARVADDRAGCCCLALPVGVEGGDAGAADQVAEPAQGPLPLRGLARVDGAAGVLRSQLQHAGELARLDEHLAGPRRVAARKLVVVQATAGLVAQV